MASTINNQQLSQLMREPWESAEHFHTAVSSGEFQRLTAGSRERFPHYPALYEVIRT
jgi:hypothetical protein